MNKTKLSRAIALCIGAASSSAHAIDVDITTMDFAGTLYLAEGQMRDDVGDLGVMQSITLFGGNPWSAVAAAYFEAGNPVPIEDNDAVSDESSVTNGTDPASWGTFTQTTSFNASTSEYTWSGMSLAGAIGTPQQPFSFTFQLAANEVAWGTFFNWNDSQSIPVLNVMDCTDPDNCTGVPGTPMVNGPFVGSDPLFFGGSPPVTCIDSFHSTLQDTKIDIDITTSLTAACSGANGVLSIVSLGTPVNGGTVESNGTTITYTPLADYNGPDSFAYTASDTINQSSANYTLQIGGSLQSNFTMLDVNGGIIGGTNDVDIVWDEITYNDPTIVPGSDNGDGFGIPADTSTVMTIGSPTPFNGFNWFAKNVRVYQGPVKLKFDVACTETDYSNNITDCSANPLPPINIGQRYIMMDLKAGEVGGHMIFDWGKANPATGCGLQNCAIDVVNIWNVDQMWPDTTPGDGRNELFQGPSGVTPALDANWALVSSSLDPSDPNLSIGTNMIDGAFKGSNANFNYKPDKAAVVADYDGQISDVDVDAFSMGLLTLLTGLFSVLGLRRLTDYKTKQ